ncbi:hypothetical protein MTR67_000899 [Solanum verrucosum]|uniref:Reverse transcriptase domain-containing protein n=1 Tax=Solanum verrucosum TaxID=315347 RepID=A0AAF0PM75_SOLVR|nr:hypothetical protein MTR67_000899 [Solanum verrucosum]
MEYLSRNLNNLKTKKSFKFHPRCANLGITHLSFADDLLLFSKGDIVSVTAMHKVFMVFSKASGLQENMNKSSIYFGGVAQSEKDRILQVLGYTQGDLPFKYLGIPLSTKKLTLLQWQPLIEKMVGRITSWTAKKLSYAGRVQLVRSVLFGIQAYWAQLFLLPTKVIKTIEAYCRS